MKRRTGKERSDNWVERRCLLLHNKLWLNFTFNIHSFSLPLHISIFSPSFSPISLSLHYSPMWFTFWTKVQQLTVCHILNKESTNIVPVLGWYKMLTSPITHKELIIRDKFSLRVLELDGEEYPHRSSLSPFSPFLPFLPSFLSQHSINKTLHHHHN